MLDIYLLAMVLLSLIPLLTTSLLQDRRNMDGNNLSRQMQRTKVLRLRCVSTCVYALLWILFHLTFALITSYIRESVHC